MNLVKRHSLIDCQLPISDCQLVFDETEIRQSAIGNVSAHCGRDARAVSGRFTISARAFKRVESAALCVEPALFTNAGARRLRFATSFLLSCELSALCSACRREAIRSAGRA